MSRTPKMNPTQKWNPLKIRKTGNRRDDLWNNEDVKGPPKEEFRKKSAKFHKRGSATGFFPQKLNETIRDQMGLKQWVCQIISLRCTYFFHFWLGWLFWILVEVLLESLFLFFSYWTTKDKLDRGPQNIFCLVSNVFPKEFVLWNAWLLLSKNVTKNLI